MHAIDLSDAGPVITDPPQWQLATALTAVGAAILMVGLPVTSGVWLAAAAIVGPMHFALLRGLPLVRSMEDYRDRHYRVNQSIWLVAVCVAVYSLIPEESRTQQGWKMNLVRSTRISSTGPVRLRSLLSPRSTLS